MASNFKKNTDGIINHDGSLRVNNTFDVLQTIVLIDGCKIHLQNSKGKTYLADKHHKLDLTFCDVGDTAFVKFNLGRPYVVGFRKEVRK